MYRLVVNKKPSVSISLARVLGAETRCDGYMEGKASLETITKTVSELAESVDRHFSEICREWGIDLAVQPPQPAPRCH